MKKMCVALILTCFLFLGCSRFRPDVPEHPGERPARNISEVEK